ncbi:MAG: hypothetical protein EBY09_14740 [Verrucomicrobia bacterium]|nr:hypothetical protein [Verrucomicrobiota bacterium]
MAMKVRSPIETFRRTLCLIAITAYAVCLCFTTLLLLSYAFHPLVGRPWLLIVSILLRWIPAAVYFWLRHRPTYITRSRRGLAVALAVTSISISYFLISFSAGALSSSVEDFLECTYDLWPCILALLTVTRRSARFPTQFPMPSLESSAAR